MHCIYFKCVFQIICISITTTLGEKTATQVKVHKKKDDWQDDCW